MAVTPAGAQVSSAVATNWKKIWKKNLKPLADKRYYTKAQSDAKYQPKGSYEPAGSGYTKAETYSKAEADAKYAASGSSYGKAESDARYAPAQALYRGTYMFLGTATAAGQAADAASISYGATFPTAPTVHYIKLGDPIPAGCSGTANAPNAAAGHLCVFESYQSNANTNRNVCRGSTPVICNAADPFGAAIYMYAAAAGSYEVHGTWAARPSGPVTNPAFVPAKPGTVNESATSQGVPTR